MWGHHEKVEEHSETNFLAIHYQIASGATADFNCTLGTSKGRATGSSTKIYDCATGFLAVKTHSQIKSNQINLLVNKPNKQS